MINSHQYAELEGLRMHYVRAGEGPDVVVLLHGWAQTWYEWRHIIPGLARRYTVIAPDLRGLGDTGKPKSGYDKKTLAGDIHRLVRHLGFERVFLVGHDFGMAVAYAYANEYPQEARALALMEYMLPGFGGELGMHVTRNGGRWHLVFHAKCELAAMLIQGKEREYLSWFYRTFSYDKSAIGERDIDEYVRCYAAPGAMGTSLEYYRTLFDDEDQNRLYGKTKLAMPLMALGGATNMGDRVMKMMQPLAEKVSGGAVERAGHWIPEERPDYLLAELPKFFDAAAR
jgi:pimeloyl-ACP methyl ester carboxylesterase